MVLIFVTVAVVIALVVIIVNLPSQRNHRIFGFDDPWRDEL